MVNKYFNGEVPEYIGKLNDVDEELEEYCSSQLKKVEELIENMEIGLALQEIWALISRTNKYIDETMPWVQAKEENKDKLKSTIYHLIENLRKIAIILTPFMGETSEKMFKQLGIKEESLKSWESLNKYNQLKDIKVIEKGEPLFMRLDAEEEIEYIKNGMKNK